MIRTLTRSFAGGEITPELYGRIDLTKFQTGLATCRNFLTLPHGPAARRPGFQYVLTAKGSVVRLIPFSFNTEQTYVIEAGSGYFRFHTNGATVLDTAKSIVSITNASPGVVEVTGHGWASYIWVYVAGVSSMTELNSRWYKAISVDANHVSLTDLYGVAIDTSLWGTASGGTISSVHEIVTPYAAGDLFDLNFVQSADVLTIVHPSYAPREVRRTAANVFGLTTIAFIPTILAPANGADVVVGSGSGSVKYKYVVTSVAEEGLEESTASALAKGSTTKAISAATQAALCQVTVTGHGLVKDVPFHIAGVTGMLELNNRVYLVNSVVGANNITLKTLDGVEVDSTGYGAYTGPSGTLFYAFIANDLTGAGAYNTITWDAVAGAVRYNVYKDRNGLYGYIGQSAALTFKDDNIDADVTLTPPEANDPFPGADDYPGAVSYFEQRRCFANTNNKPQNYWLTRSGTESNMTFSIPTQDDDTISGRVVAREVNEIRHFVPLSELLLLTSGGEWRMSSAAGALTPASLEIRPQSYVGASQVIPQVTGNSVLYVQSRGSRVRELTYSWEASSYKSSDVSIMAPHLFDGKTLVDMAYVRAPEQMLWATRSDGKLLGFTYVPEHQVTSWHQHDTDGLFESVAAVSETDHDVLYAVVKRNINGASLRYIEFMHEREFTDLEDWFGVDSGLTYSGAAATVISGLHHLEGETVAILADGKVKPQQVVTDGAITLADAASKVHIGLPYVSDAKTLPLSFEAQAAGQGRKKNVNKVHLRVNKASGIWAGPDASNLREYAPRTTEPYGSPPVMQTGEIELSIVPTWADGSVFIRQQDPLPMTLVSMTLEVEVGG